MIKSISRAESLTMRRMLSAYKEHVTKYPSNLLMKLLGLYRLRVNSEKYDVVVIQNVFETSKAIHERFDLKGERNEEEGGMKAKIVVVVVVVRMGKKGGANVAMPLVVDNS